MRPLAVLAVLGLIGGVVGVAVAGQVHDGRVQETRKLLTNVSDALEVYRAHHQRYPSTAEGLEVLVSEANLLESVPKDAWDGELIYVSTGPRRFELRSKGRDGVAESKDDMLARSRNTRVD